MKLKNIIKVLFLVAVVGVLISEKNICADETKLTFDHTYPKTVKVGQEFDDYYVNVYGLYPYEYYMIGVPEISNTCYTDFGGSGGPEGVADKNGNILGKGTYFWSAYKTGELKVTLRIGRYLNESLTDAYYKEIPKRAEYVDENGNTVIATETTYIRAEGEEVYKEENISVCSIMVEKPVITHNAPDKVMVGDNITLTTQITNTAYENIKISQAQKTTTPLYYVPMVEIIEGSSIVKQSSQDYTNTLSTSEKLNFTGSGTVKLKVSYMPTLYKGHYTENGGYELSEISLSDGVVEEIITISVKGKEQDTLDEDVYITTNIPKTFKIGDSIEDIENLYITYHGLTPNKKVYYRENFKNYFESIYSLNAGGFGESAVANNKGEISGISTPLHKPFIIPGEVSIFAMWSYDDENIDEPLMLPYKKAGTITFKVEEPIIKENAPDTVDVGDVIELKTELTNINAENHKLDVYENTEANWYEYNVEHKTNSGVIAYRPIVTIIEGEELVSRSEGDYTNTLNSYEKLTFKGAGTVKLKITYEFIQTWYCNSTYSPEKEITILIRDENATTEEITTEEITTEETTTEETTTEVKKENDKFFVEVKDEITSIDIDEFKKLINENKDKDVVIKINDDIEFSFEKGSMKEVDGKKEYDFGTEIFKKYEKKSEYGDKIKEKNFVLRINFNYSGELPGKASIKINVGTDKKGMTLYYSQIYDDGKITYVCSAKVDDEGYITVSQDHCSDYVLTSERIDNKEEKNKGIIPIIILITVLVATGVIAAIIVIKKKRKEKMN